MSYKTLKKLLIWERKQKKMGCSLPTATMLAEVEEVEIVPSVLLPCPTCSRTFRSEALSKHIKVCEKTLMKKRKKFDSSKQRIQGTDLAQFLKSSKTLKSSKPPSPKREPTPSVKEKVVAPPAKSKITRAESIKPKPPDHEQCPYCERFFGPKAYERHIEWCKEQQHKKQVQSDETMKAKERLQARTKYQAPLKANKTTKEKYSLMARQGSTKQSSNHAREEYREKSPPSSSRQGVNKSNFKHRSPTISDTSRQRTSSLSSCEQKSQCSSEMENSDGSPRPGRPRAKPKMTNAATASRDLGKYDPFVSAELQMMELLKSDSKDELKRTQALHIVDPSPPSDPSPSNPSLLQSDDTIKKDNDSSTLNNDNKKPVSKMLSLSTLSLCSTVSIDSLDFNVNPKRSSRRANSALASKNKSKLNMHNLLYGHNDDNNGPEEPYHNDNNNNPSMKEREDLAACEAELLESMMEFEKLLNAPSPIPFSPKKPLSSDNNNTTQPTIFSIDSAYSSLNRRSPNEGGGDDGSRDDVMSKFCHECGGRYPVPSAKFCCVCGVRRISI